MKILGRITYFPWGYAMILLTIALLAIYVPLALTVAISMLVLAMCLLEGLKLKLWTGFGKRPESQKSDHTPRISVHLAISSEPSGMVIDTIRSILAQEYSNFEIIVVDNNTKNDRLWKPVSAFCKPLEDVRFFHLKHWPFYKSGALNFARKVSDPEAEFIFIVDADYRLTPDALNLAVSNVESRSIALVQFPQAYSCHHERHIPLLKEFDHFFDYYCSKADSCYGALATGTLSLIRIMALDAVGGWPVNSITEDAELGARLQARGHDIKYVHRVIGKGIAPTSQEDFLKQRKRWIFGNIQTLLNYSLSPVKHFDKWISGVSQLTAWANGLGVPILCLLCVILLSPWMEANTFGKIVAPCYWAFAVFVLSKMLQLQLLNGPKYRRSFRTFLIHFSSLDIGAFHWWPVLLGRERPFIRTDKSGTQSEYRINIFYPCLHSGIFLCSIGHGLPLIALGALCMAMLHLMSILLDYRCRSDATTNVMFNLKIHL